MRLSLISTLLLAAATGVFADDGSDVIDITAANFETIVTPAELILVEFFAPWCGHCKALAPHYEEAATILKAKNIPLAKVDCVDQSELCQQQGVSGYPTIKVFRNGTPSEYGGPRKTEGIVSYMVKQSLPAVTTVTSENHEEFIKADKVVVVIYAEAPAPVFTSTAEQHREEYLFGSVNDPAVIQAAGISQPAIVVYKKFDEGRNNYPSSVADLRANDLTSWLKEVSVPLLDEVSGENYAFYAETGLPLAYLFVNPTEAGREELVSSFIPLAKTHKGKVNFVWIDALKFADHGKAMNLHEVKWPAFVIQDIGKQLKYPFDQSKEVTVEAITAFVSSYVSGALEPELKSQPIPETQDESVFVLVTKQFDEVVYDDAKDVFVEFYAPWCGHCKRLKPTWDSLGDKYASIKDRIVIAKMDTTENDIPPSAPFRVTGFPTIKFKPAGSREFFDYEGDRTLESLVEFVEAKAKNSLEPNVGSESAGSSTVEETAVPKETVATGEEPQVHVEL